MTAVGEDAKVRVHLLGRFELRAGDRTVMDHAWPYAKAKSVLKLLSLSERRALHRERILDALWPDLDPAAAANNLRQALHQVRSALLEGGVEASVVERRGEMVTLTPEVLLDLDVFRDKARLALERRDETSLYDDALSAYGGDLLPEDAYEEWTQRDREALRNLHHDLLIGSATLHQAQGSVAIAVERLQALLEEDPVNEDAHRRLIRTYAQAGLRERALRQYQACHEALERELGMEPSAETEAAYQDVLEGSDGMRGARPEAGTSMTAQHGTTTILFTDLAGSTELGSRLGDDAVLILRRAHERILEQQFTGHGGRVVKNTGDGFMVAFASARQAVECAAAVQRAIEEQHAEGRYPELRVRIGVHTGEPAAEGDDFFGNDVDLARRIADEAPPGEVWVSEVTRLLSQKAQGVEFDSRGEQHLKGFDEPFALYALRVEVERTAHLTRFIGREGERSLLRKTLDLAARGQGAVVLITGEPGVGKTRLASEVAIEAGDRGFAVLSGRAFESEGGAPYASISDALARYARKRPPAELQAAMKDGGSYVTKLVPQLRRLTASAPEAALLEPDAERYRLYEDVSDFITNLAMQKPVLLFLDDLHWADAGTIPLLQHLARRARESRVMIAGTYRDADVDESHPLAGFARDLTRQRIGRRIDLSPFDRGESEELLASIARTVPSPLVVEALHEDTRGNALFLVETARSLVEQGHDLSSPDASLEGRVVPETVRGVIGERLSRLDAQTREVLEQAAVIGGNLATPIIAAATGDRERVVLVRLEEAHRARILEEEGDDFVFAHPLIQQTVYQGLSAPRRSLLHRQAGEALEHVYGQHPEHVMELAHHFVEGGDRSKAFEYSKLAGQRARDLLAYEEAAQHLAHALDLVPDEQAAERCDLLLNLGGMLWMAGNSQAATQVRSQAIDLARGLAAPELLARAALELRTGYGQLELEVDEEHIKLLEEALEALGPGDSALSAKLLAELAARFYMSPDEARRMTISEQAVDMARRVGDSEALAAALIVRHYALRAPRYIEERLAAADEIIGLGLRNNVIAIALSGYSSKAEDLMSLGDLAGADAALEAQDELNRRLQHPSGVVNKAQIRAMRALFQGSFEEAEQYAHEALELGRRRGSRTVIAIFGTQLFLLYKEQGRLADLEEGHRALTERYPTIPAYRCALATLYCELGKTEEAKSQFEHLAIGSDISLPNDTNWLTGMAFLAESCAFLRDERRAKPLYELFLPYSGKLVMVGYGTLCLGPADRCLGLLAATMSSWTEAERHFSAGLEMSRQTGARPWSARVALEFAAMLLERQEAGDRERASELLDEARQTADELRMQRLAQQIGQVSVARLEQEPLALDAP